MKTKEIIETSAIALFVIIGGVSTIAVNTSESNHPDNSNKEETVTKPIIKDESNSKQELKLYKDNITLLIKEWSGYQKDFATLNERMVKDHSLSTDPKWVENMSRTIVNVIDVTDRMLEVNVPKEMKEYHTTVTKAVNEVQFVTVNYSKAVGNDNVALFKECIQKLENAYKLFLKVIDNLSSEPTKDQTDEINLL